MKALQQSMILPVILPGAIKDDAAWTSKVVDTALLDGAKYVSFVGALGDTDVALAVLKVMESDELTDADTLGGTPSLVKDATTKPGASDDGKIFVFGVDLTGPRKRYLQLQATAGDGTAGTYLTALAIALPGVSGSDAANRNLLFAEYA